MPGGIFLLQRVGIMAEDPSVSRTDQTGNQDYQRNLAISLVSSLGIEAAMHTCQSNGWDGVLKWVVALRETGERNTGRP